MEIYLIILFTLLYISYIILKDIKTKKVIKKENSIDNKKLNDKATEKFITKDYESCVIISDLILTIDPYNSKALVNRAMALECLNFNLDAINDYEKYMEIDGTDPNVYGLLGLTYRKIGEIEIGQEYLLKSINMGYSFYKMQYEILENSHILLKKKIKEKSKNPELLKKRNPNDIKGNFSEVNNEELLKAFENGLELLRNNKDLNKHINLKEIENKIKNRC